MLGASFNVAVDFDPDVQGCVGYASTRILVGDILSCAEFLGVVL